MKKKIIKLSTTFIILLFLLVVSFKLYERHEYNQKGILLSFDDYSENTWSDTFDLFDQYDVKVTFFINGAEPTEFCYDAIERGHEIGYHTLGHAKLTETTTDEFYMQAIEPLKVFHDAGIYITSFAYPYGEYDEWMNEELLKHYKTTRGAWYYRGTYKKDVNNGFMESFSIDNVHYASDEEFRAQICERLDGLVACDPGTVVSFFSHSISTGDWCITPERLIILFEEAEKRNLKFYTFKDLQN